MRISVFDFHVLVSVRCKMKLPVEIKSHLLHNYSTKMPETPSGPLTLPFDVLVNIFYRLDIIDQSVLALSCKHMASTYSASVPVDLVNAKKRRSKKSLTNLDDGSAMTEPLKITGSAIANEIAKRKRPATRLRKIEFLLRFHHDGACKAMPGFRLCLTCATFKPKRGAWGGDTSYLRKRKVSNQDTTRGSRCKS